MKPQEKAKLLIQKAQDKAKADFEAWKGGTFAEKLKHREPLEARDILRHRYTAIEDWYLSNNTPKGIFDVRGTDPESLIRAWELLFVDWEEGLIPIPGKTPGYEADKIPFEWINALAQLYKAVFCMEHLDTLLQGGTVKEQKPNTKILALYYYYTRPDLSGHKTELVALGKKLGLSSGRNFYQCFNAVGHINNPKNPLKPEILREVIPMLEEFPEAQDKAKKDLEQLKRGKGK